MRIGFFINLGFVQHRNTTKQQEQQQNKEAEKRNIYGIKARLIIEHDKDRESKTKK